MMLFKLSLKNIKKSFKDYAIYFVTLILGVAIFYVFNSLDSQQAMTVMGASTSQIIEMMIQLLSGISVFVSFILGFLIVYANNFLIKRRKKEFGIYMTLGMGKKQISRILLGETLLIGMVSLAAGLAVGVFGAQFMSLLVVKMFGGVMEGYQFVFSKAAFFKTIGYFGIMFVIVAVFNVVTISRYRLIKLLSARKENEQVKMKNPVVCFFVFLVSAVLLGNQYYKVCHPETLEFTQIGLIILSGCIGTFLFFWSLSGFLLNITQHHKKYYLRDLNAFVLRQIHSKINTTVFAMTLICLMLFLTISILAGGLGMNYSLQKMLGELTPVDVNIYTEYNENNQMNVYDKLQEEGFDVQSFKEGYEEVTLYRTEEVTMEDTIGAEFFEIPNNNTGFFARLREAPEDIMKVSDYNKIARIYGLKELKLPESTYAIICDYETIQTYRDEELAAGRTISLNEKELKPAYKTTQYGFLYMMANHANAGIVIVPDEEVKEEWKSKSFLAGNYKTDSTEELESFDEQLSSLFEREIYFNSKLDIVAASGGLAAVVTFIAIYLGIIFLISSAAILALKELSESSDNRERYDMLRKIGADEKMINKALFRQIAIFFFIPLLLAVVHSVFGMTFISKILDSMGKLDNMNSILSTAGILLAVYGGYFLITYFGSKRIIQNKM